ncbi:hypothetical protein AVEN_88674-1 [Araneus ventricosus]|uniref:Uncharacterized protein n=1 Tax=Araneus ventricosus TaxID=182803 RepID=A0A4Y2LSR8_ARAVE|nr:hypothetical protein AVEN_88674-1 [Araneus ventricosus]
MQNKSGENCPEIENFICRAKRGRCRPEEEWGVVSKRLTPRQRRRGERATFFSNTAKPLLQFPPLLKMSLTTASPYLRCNSGARGETLERESTGSVTSADDIASADEFRPSAHGHRGKLFRDGIYHLKRLFLHCRMKYDEDEKPF